MDKISATPRHSIGLPAAKVKSLG